MSLETTTLCPHCGSANAATAAFCGSCGKALPSGSDAGPRIISGPETPDTDLGRSMFKDGLTKQMKKAATALMWVAILQTIFGPIMLFIEKEKAQKEAPPGVVFEVEPIAWVIVLGIAVAFWGLFLWARRSPLPAAIVGLVLFVTIHLLDALADPTMLIRGWLVKIIVVVILCKAISAGIEYRKLSEGSESAGPPVA